MKESSERHICKWTSIEEYVLLYEKYFHWKNVWVVKNNHSFQLFLNKLFKTANVAQHLHVVIKICVFLFRNI